MYTFGIKESAKVDLEAQKGHKAIVGGNANWYTNGNNFLTLEFNDRKFIEANWFGQVNFKKSGSYNEYYSLYDLKTLNFIITELFEYQD